MVIAEANYAEKIRAGEHEPAAGSGHARQFRNERFRFLDMFQDVQRADAGKKPSGKGSRLPS